MFLAGAVYHHLVVQGYRVPPFLSLEIFKFLSTSRWQIKKERVDIAQTFVKSPDHSSIYNLGCLHRQDLVTEPNLHARKELGN